MDTQTTEAGQVIDVNGIMQRIPHRYPFLLIDKVQDMIPGESAVGVKNVTVNEPFFQGHFPDHPIMPGVLIVEAMAQTAAVVVIDGLDGKDDSLVYFMTIDSARFRRPVRPGDTLHIHVTRLQSRGNVWKFRGEAKVDGQLMAEAVFAAMIVEQK